MQSVLHYNCIRWVLCNVQLWQAEQQLTEFCVEVFSLAMCDDDDDADADTSIEGAQYDMVYIVSRRATPMGRKCNFLPRFYAGAAIMIVQHRLTDYVRNYLYVSRASSNLFISWNINVYSL